jgi:hypothetical protein
MPLSARVLLEKRLQFESARASARLHAALSERRPCFRSRQEFDQRSGSLGFLGINNDTA